MEIILKGNQLRALKYLYLVKDQADTGASSTGGLFTYVYNDSIFEKEFLENDVKALESMYELIEIYAVNGNEKSIRLLDKGKAFIEKYYNDEKKRILEDIFIDYKFAFLNYLSRRNEFIRIDDFPIILRNFAPKLENRTPDLNLRAAIYSLSEFIDKKDDPRGTTFHWYQINEFGLQYLAVLKDKQKKTALKIKLEEELPKSIIDTNKSVKKMGNYTLGVAILSLVAIAAAAIIALFGVTSKDIQQLNSTMSNNSILLHKINQSQIKIDSLLLKLESVKGR